MKNINDTIDKGETPYLIAEIGINHNGDIRIAKKLIDAANACGWHCAKFQKRNLMFACRKINNYAGIHRGGVCHI